MNYYKEIKNKILDNEAYARIKDYSKERHKVLTYFEIGRLLHEAGKHYGEGIIQKYAYSLEKEFGKKYDKQTLYRMRQLYLLFREPKWSTLRNESIKSIYYKENSIQKQILPLPQSQKPQVSPSQEQKVVSAEDLSLKTLYNKDYFNQKVVSLDATNTICPLYVTKLTWTHYRFILPIMDDNERNYYVNTAITNQLSVRELRARIKSKEYERLDEKTRTKLMFNNDLNIKDYIPNPILIKNTSNTDIINEKMLHNLIKEDITSFMKELGDGYSFIDSEYKIKIDDRYNYIDFLLYNIKYKCYVVVELKVTEFKSEYLGQILKYMYYIDKNLKTIDEDKTIGIIICRKNNQFYLEYCSDSRVISREYKLI